MFGSVAPPKKAAAALQKAEYANTTAAPIPALRATSSPSSSYSILLADATTQSSGLDMCKEKERPKTPTGMQPLPPPPRRPSSILPASDHANANDQDMAELEEDEPAHASDLIIEFSVQPLVDVRSLPPPDRRILALGPRVQVTVNREFVDEIPERLLLAVSTKAQAIVTSNPGMQVHRMHLKPTVEKWAVIHVFKWLRKNSKTRTPFSLPFCASHRENLSICHAAHELGMGPYAHSIFNAEYKYLKCMNATFEELAIIEKQSNPEYTSHLRAAASRLAWVLHRGFVDDAKLTWDFLKGCPKISDVLNTKVATFKAIEAERKGRRADRMGAGFAVDRDNLD